MFGNFGGVEFLVIILIAVFLWGPDKLPEALRNLRRFIAKARQMASNAASDLSREIGTDIKPEDLNPKTFVRKHILSEEDQEMLTNPLKSTMKDLQDGTKPLKDDLEAATRDIDSTRRSVNSSRINRNSPKATTGEAADTQGESGGERPASRYDDAT